ncbi:MAG: SGNH/GDSL hydrolase family protein [Halioglobus sp.]|nr:SGNH/GDSL hydrolase family protein [Halioglobus sp.]
MKPSSLTKLVLINLGIITGLLFLLEGAIRYFRIGHEFFTQKVAERQHTEYDEELGWINLPGITIPDMYSREDPLTINSQRYRSTQEFSIQVPAGKIRIICAGDSFTLGFGVGDPHTWCQQLTTLDKQLETVNMGQGGYGVDQAFLWYRRDEQKLEHDIVVFAFIRDDFYRMESETFMGYGKPILSVQAGKLVQENYPVPRQSYDASWLRANLHMWFQLDTIQWLSDLLGDILSNPGSDNNTKAHRDTEEVVDSIFASLEDMSIRNQRRTILAYLPTRGDISQDRPHRWEQLVTALAKTHDYHLINVADAMRKLPQDETENMFRGGGHYTDEGNRYVAEVIYQYLATLPDLKEGAFIERVLKARSAGALRTSDGAPDVTNGL